MSGPNHGSPGRGGANTGARLDHVAIAVPDREAADRLYVGRMGGGRVALARNGGVEIEQIRYGNGCKLELLSPYGESTGATRLAEHLATRPGSLHHITLIVESLDDAMSALEDEGVRCVGVAEQPDGSREAFVLPRDAAGLLVQLVWKDVSDDEWARRHGQTALGPDPGAARFLGARTGHRDLGGAGEQLARLGADVCVAGEAIEAWWDDPGLRLWLVPAPAPVELVFDGAAPRAADPVSGPAIVDAAAVGR